ncbi:rCG25540 [Rattus norvegicus]|uniref:RCG25540 n=1 Tax=Rattus norvegicus TaxID=10116 RepID=A6I2K2_RAT|nr:rCG25540 [Rattus norvegicus]
MLPFLLPTLWPGIGHLSPETGSHCIALATYYVDQAGLELTETHLPAKLLGLKKPTEVRRGIGSPGTELTDVVSCCVGVGCWERNLGPLQEQRESNANTKCHCVQPSDGCYAHKKSYLMTLEPCGPSL